MTFLHLLGEAAHIVQRRWPLVCCDASSTLMLPTLASSCHLHTTWQVHIAGLEAVTMQQTCQMYAMTLCSQLESVLQAAHQLSVIELQAYAVWVPQQSPNQPYLDPCLIGMA
jgi:hypothetical protein